MTKNDIGGPEALSGLIERVTFFNEETGFAVLRVNVKGQREVVTVVGSVASVSAGEWLTAEGQWSRERDYGMQFKADLLKTAPPDTAEGIEKYLGSGLIKGIGPVYAKKLVGRFGSGVFDVIDQFSSRLEEVEGIGPQRRRRIKEAWAEQKVVREIMVFLHSHGVGTSRAVRIYKTYGEEAITKLRENPYILARDISGIGFKTADQIAQRLGISANSMARARAGLAHVLQAAAGEGHCALPESALLEGAQELLAVPLAIVEQALAQSVAAGETAREVIMHETLIFLPVLQRAEEGIAARMRAQAAGRPVYPPIDIEKALGWWQGKSGTELAPTQQAALREVLGSRGMVITGGPGVGKTTLLKAVLDILRAKKVRCVLCAPTGRAARRLSEASGLEAKTIHRLLEGKPGGGFLRDEQHPLSADLVVMDESSMVDVVLMHRFLRALPRSCALLLVGDTDQLPSVGPGNVLRDLITSELLPVVRLTEVFRQAAGSRIITAAHEINAGRVPESDGKDADFHFIEREEPEAIRETLIEVVRRRIPRRLGIDSVRDIQVLSPMNRGSLGIRELNATLQEKLNPAPADAPCVEKFGSVFRVGDKVIQTRNNYEKDVFNGDIGLVTGIDPVEREVLIRFDGRDALYDFGELDELALAYAITIHKSQGSEFPAVVIPIATQQFMLLQRNLIYTGITRGRRLVVLIGQRKAFEMAVRNDRTRHRHGGLLARLNTDSAS